MSGGQGHIESVLNEYSARSAKMMHETRIFDCCSVGYMLHE